MNHDLHAFDALAERSIKESVLLVVIRSLWNLLLNQSGQLRVRTLGFEMIKELVVSLLVLPRVLEVDFLKKAVGCLDWF